MSPKKSIAIAGFAATIAATSIVGAFAADLGQTIGPDATDYGSLDVALATDNWTGFYVGAHGSAGTTDKFDKDDTTLSGGIQAGYMQQFGAFVVGGEASGTLYDGLQYQLAPGAGLEQKWSVEAKVRAGVAIDQTLIYGTAGIAMAELSPTGDTTSDKKTHTGAVFGAGVEQGIGNGFSLRAEYTQTRFFDVSSSVGGLGRSDELTNHAVKAGVNYRF